MRITRAKQVGIEPDLFHQRAGGLFGGFVARAMDNLAISDGIFHRHARIERGVGILKDHLHQATHISDFQTIFGRYSLPVKNQFAAVRRDQMHQQPGEG